MLMSHHSTFSIMCTGSTENISFQTTIRHNQMHSYILGLRLGIEFNLCTCTCTGATWWCSWLRHCFQVRRSVRFQMVSLEFFIDMILLATLWPGGRLRL